MTALQVIRAPTISRSYWPARSHTQSPAMSPQKCWSWGDPGRYFLDASHTHSDQGQDQTSLAAQLSCPHCCLQAPPTAITLTASARPQDCSPCPPFSVPPAQGCSAQASWALPSIPPLLNPLPSPHTKPSPHLDAPPPPTPAHLGRKLAQPTPITSGYHHLRWARTSIFLPLPNGIAFTL